MNWWVLLPLAGVAGLSAILLLRRRPLLALAVLLAGSVAMKAVPTRLLLLPLLLPILLTGLDVCFIAATRPRRVSIAAAVLTIGVQVYWIEGGSVLFFRLAARPASPLAVSLVSSVTLTTVVAWLAGYLIRQNDVHAETVRAQAQAQAVTAERLRIARELHDMVAHSIGVIAVQAGMGSRVIDTQPAEAREALSAIEAASRETLAGLRRMLGALRRAESGGSRHPAGPGGSGGSGGPGGGPDRGPLAPAPGLADLGRLAAMTMDAGVRVDLQQCGRPRPLPAEVDVSAFRIIQEAVTNVVRHAGADRCRVLIDHREQELSIEVTDDGRGTAVASPGYGIAGMRERAALLGGQLAAGPRPGGGFQVTARLPVPAG
jgi:signal transduction histidine kinase